MQKRLSELDGEIVSIDGRPQLDDCLFFTCPTCPGGHGIAVSWLAPSLVAGGFVWQKVSGDTIENITINPSINCDVPWTSLADGKTYPSQCKFHGWVRDGWVQW